MAAEGVEIKDEQIPPHEEGGEDEVRGTSDSQLVQRNRALHSPKVLTRQR